MFKLLMLQIYNYVQLSIMNIWSNRPIPFISYQILIDRISSISVLNFQQ